MPTVTSSANLTIRHLAYREKGAFQLHTSRPSLPDTLAHRRKRCGRRKRSSGSWTGRSLQRESRSRTLGRCPSTTTGRGVSARPQASFAGRCLGVPRRHAPPRRDSRAGRRCDCSVMRRGETVSLMAPVLLRSRSRRKTTKERWPTGAGQLGQTLLSRVRP